MISLRLGALLMSALIAGAFVASPELRAYAANTVGSADIINESVLSADIKNGEVKSPDIANGGVTNADIAPNAITTSKINDGAVKNADIENGAVTTGKIANEAVTTEKLANNVFDDLQNQLDDQQELIDGLLSQMDLLLDENAAQQAEIDDLVARVGALEGGSGDPDPANVDNDLDGFTENAGDCNDSDSDVNPDALESFNEIDDNCDEQVDNPHPDQYEANEAQLDAYNLGTISEIGSISIQANMAPADELGDWYSFVWEDVAGVGTGVTVNVTLDQIGTGSNYDLGVFDATGALSLVSTNAGNADEIISFNLEDNPDTNESNVIYVAVGKVLQSGIEPYQLDISVTTQEEPINPVGTFDLDPVPSYQCADIGLGPLVDFSPEQFVFSGTSTLIVNGDGLPTMSGDYAGDGDIDVSATIPGGCAETYSLTGEFTDANSWTATFEAEYSGPGCEGFGDPCTNQSWSVEGLRASDA